LKRRTASSTSNAYLSLDLQNIEMSNDTRENNNKTTYQFKLLLLRIQRNIQLLYIILDRAMRLRHLDDLHLLICALLLERVDLASKPLHFLLEDNNPFLRRLELNIHSGLLFDDLVHTVLRLVLLPSDILQSPCLLVHEALVLALERAHLLAKALGIVLALQHALRVLQNLGVALV
jgi:hypothetical protein